MKRPIHHQASMKSEQPKFGVLGFIQALRFLVVWAMVVICFGSSSAIGQKEANTGETSVQPTFEHLETDAIAFVQEHHPELVSLLQSLKAMRKKEYEMAIR